MMFRHVSLYVWAALATLPPLGARELSLRWEAPGAAGAIKVDRGTLVSAAAAGGTVQDGVFQLPLEQPGRLDFTVTRAPDAGALPTIVTVELQPRGFSFRLNEVDAKYPIYLREDQVIVTEAADSRTYAEIVADIAAREGQTKLQRIAAAPEASFAAAAAVGRDIKEETWLGLGRDMRIFRMDVNLETFQPKFAGFDVKLPEVTTQIATYAFQFGRGRGPRVGLSRGLDNGYLPILRGTIDDEAIQYDVTFFTTLEKSTLTAENLRGTDYLVADSHSHGRMLTSAQWEVERSRREVELNPSEEVVLYARAVATNHGKAPQYAMFKTVTPSLATPVSPRLPQWNFEEEHGFGTYESGRVFAVSKLAGQALPAEEYSVLLRPGESVALEIMVPHRPIDRDRALALAAQSFDTRLEEARAFWQGRLAEASRWHLPEPRIDAMVRAGLLHLDLIIYGHQSPAPLLPGIGIYTAIGSESAPIIQFMDTMGLTDIAERSLDFFFAKQHDNGFMQNFNGYMLETGAVLWAVGEHYRYTQDKAWLRRIHAKVTLAWHYIRDWRARNLQPELRGDGYGMLDGKTADPEDPFRSYMLNGYAYLGVARTAEILREIDPVEAAECLELANTLKADIRATLTEAMQRAPVVPLGDGTWSRTVAPWTGYRGPLMLHTDGGKWFTHGSMVSRDSLLGPLYLAYQEVLDPKDPMTEEILRMHSELMLRDNVAFTQPYYSRHPWVHLQRGETKEFLQAWYGSVAALADRETYTFTEHFFPASAHKTHEEAWFLMETRWMLYLEHGDTLRLLAGVPRAWLKPDARIAVEKAGSYFGELSFEVTVSPDGKTVRAAIDCAGDRRPQVIELRVPHPSEQPARSVEGGIYDAVTETIRIADFTGKAEVVLRFE